MQQGAGTLLVGLRALHDHVEQDLERRGAELALLRPDVGAARLEVEDRVGMDVVDADASLLEVPRLLRRQRPGRVEPALEAVDVGGAPGAGLAVGAVAAPLEVVVVVGDVPVPDVDHVQDTPAALTAAAPADRLLEEQPERPGGDRLGREVTNALARLQLEPAAAEQQRPCHPVRKREPALRVEQEVVLKALRDQDVPRLLVLWRSLRRGHPGHPTASRSPCQAGSTPGTARRSHPARRA